MWYFSRGFGTCHSCYMAQGPATSRKQHITVLSPKNKLLQLNTVVKSKILVGEHYSHVWSYVVHTHAKHINFD